MAKKDVMIKDAPLVEVINGAEKIPVSDGSNEPRAVNLQQIKFFVGADTPLSKGQGENSVKQTPPSPTFEKKNEILADEKGEFIEADALGDYAVALGGTAAAIGKRSVAQGHRCIAEGETSHAEGNCAVVKYVDEALNGYGSHAEGYSTVVAGVYSHAEGSKTVVVGNNSHAEGGETGVSADMAHAEGYKTSVLDGADGAHAEGNSTSAEAKYSHTEGRQTTTLGEGAHAEGTETTAMKDYSHSEGKGTNSNGLYSHAEGIDSETNAAGSHAEGFETHANNECSHAEGHGAVANGMYAHAEGWVTNAIGEASHAEGQNTRARQIGSHSEGNNTEAKGAYSHAEGIGTKTKEGVAGQHVEGYYNKETDSLKVIGCGTSDEDRKNAVEVTQDGRVFVKGIGNYDGTSLEAVDLKTSLDHKANSGDVYNKTELDNRIKVDLVRKVEVATINGQSLINGGNIVIEGGEGSSATPDWNAQEGEEGYIKNRTHYFNPTATVSASAWTFDNSGEPKTATAALNADWLYRLEWNDNTYYIKTNSTDDFEKSVISDTNFRVKHKCVGGQHSLECSRYGNDFTEAPVEVKGTGINAATSMGFLKPLDELFIPESIARKSELTELSGAIALRNVGAEDTDESVEEPDLPTPSASNEWKCVFDGRMEVGVRNLAFTTFADGTPLKAKELIVQILMDKNAAKSSQGYVRVQSTTNKNMAYYGAIHFEAALSNGVPSMSQCKMVASPYTYMVAEIIDKMPLAVAQGEEVWGRAGSNNAAQIYEDFVFVKVGPSNPTTEAAPYLKIYAR